MTTRAARWIAGLLASLALALLAIRGAALDFSLHPLDGRLVLGTAGATLDLGPARPGVGLRLRNVGPQERRSPVYLLRRGSFASETLAVVRSFHVDEQDEQPELAVAAAQLERGPVGFRFWNPFHPAVVIAWDDGAPVGSVRFRVYENVVVVESGGATERVAHFAPPLGRLIAAGLVFAVASGLALACALGLVAALTAKVQRPRGLRMPRVRALPRVLADHDWLLAFAVGAACVAYVHFRVLEAVPGFGDEMNYLVQARVLATGHVSVPAPEPVDAFRVPWMDLLGDDGRLWNFHPIGNSLLLAAGLLAGSASLVPILVGGGLFAAFFALARALFGSRWPAWLGIALLASSQYVLTLAASFMAHAPALLFVELGTLGAVLFVKGGRERAAALAGAAFGAAFLMRPLSAVLAGLVPGVVMFVYAVRHRRYRALAIAAALLLAVASVELWRTYFTVGRFTLGYLAKGPESQHGLAELWARGGEWRLTNLFLNFRLFHDRLFGLGPAGNLVFVFVPLLALRRLRWLVLAYASVALYWIGHSVVHFYGWMWEPRMLFELTHLVVLLSAGGLWLLVSGEAYGPRWARPVASLAAAGVGAAFLAWNVGHDLPERFANEYRHYNRSDRTLRDQLRARGITNALLFHDDETFGFAPHLPDNAIEVRPDGSAAFSGPVVHAIHRGDLRDQALVARHPGRRVFRVHEGPVVEEVPSFYRDALPRVRALAEQHASTHDVVIGLPWLASSDLAIRGARVLDDAGFLAWLRDAPATRRPGLAVLVGPMRAHVGLVHDAYASARERPADGFSYPLRIVEFDPASRRGPLAAGLGLVRSVYPNARCQGEAAETARVGLVDFDASGRKDVCVQWASTFDVPQTGTYTFATRSDDGSAVLVDGRPVVDNGRLASQGLARREASVLLAAGAHTLDVSYVQFAGPAFLEASVRSPGGTWQPLAAGAFGTSMRARPTAPEPSATATGPRVRGTSVALGPVDPETSREPIAEVTDPGPEPGSLALTVQAPYRVSEYPRLAFDYRMDPGTAYSVLVRLVGDAPDDWKEITMRADQRVRDEGRRIGTFDATQDGAWHRVTFDLARALEGRDAQVAEIVMGEFAGAAVPRTLYFRRFEAGPGHPMLRARNPDNRVRVVGPTHAASPPAPAPAPTASTAAPARVAAPSRPPGVRISSSRGDPGLEANAVDGDPQTRWDTREPQRGGEWFQVDLPAPASIAGVHIDTAPSPKDYPRELEVQVSADGATFRTIATVRDAGPVLDLPVRPAVRGRALRLVQRGRDVVYFWSIHELEVRGPDGPLFAPQRRPAPTPAPARATTTGPAVAPDGPVVEPSQLAVSSFRDEPLLEARAIDGSQGSRWDTGKPQAGGEWLQVDLPGVGELAQVRVHVDGFPHDYPRALQVSASEDGRHFTTVATVEGRAPDTDIAFTPPLRCRSVRLTQTGSDPVYFWAVNELTVWGRFPPRARSLAQRVTHAGAWLALLALLAAWAAAVLASRRWPTRLTAAEPVGRRWRAAALVTVALFLGVLLATQRDYGETWDEFEHFENGAQYVDYLFGSGRVPEIYFGTFRQYYGPFSDIVSASLTALLHERLGVMSLEGARHLHLNLLFAACALAAFFAAGREHGGRAGYLCLVVLAVSPHLLGHVHNNMKDFAVTAWMLLAALAFHDALVRRSLPRMAVTGLLTGFALATKINGALLAPVFVVTAALFVWRSASGADGRRARVRFVLASGLVLAAIAVGTMVACWPWLWDSPWLRFPAAARFFRQHIWNGPVLYRGRVFAAADVPRTFAPDYLLIATPLAFLPFAVLGAARAVVEARRGRLLPALCVFGVLASIAPQVLTSVPIYDGVRHFLPAFAFLALVVGFGIDWIFRPAARPAERRLAALVASFAVGAVALQDVRLHPYQTVYFNALVGGARGAAGRFELDYWGSSLQEAGRYVNVHAAPGAKVHVVLGLERLARLRPDLVVTESNPDYAIVIGRETLAPDPYRGQEPEYVVRADGADLSRVYARPRVAP